MASPLEEESRDVSMLLRQSIVHNTVAVRYRENVFFPISRLVKIEFLDHSYSVIPKFM